MRKGRSKKVVGFVLSGIFVALVTYWMASRLSLLTGFPKGVDAYAYLTRTNWILTRFPQIHWNPSWDSGNYFWLWSYPPPGSIASALAAKILSLSVEQALSLVSFASFLLLAITLLATLTSWAGSWLALPVVLLAVTTPALWSWWGHGGNYIRVWGLGFYGLSMALFVQYLKRPKRLLYVLLAFTLSFTLTSHILVGGMTIATVGAYTLFAVQGWKKRLAVCLKTFGVAFPLAAWFYLPMIISKPGGRFFELVKDNPIRLSGLLAVNPRFPFFSLPLIFTASAILTLASACLGALWQRKKVELTTWAAVPAFLLGCLGAIAYLFFGHFSWYPPKAYISGFATFAMLPVLVIFVSFLLAGVLGVLFQKFKYSKGTIFFSFLACLLILVSSWQADFAQWRIYDMTQPGESQPLAILPVRELDHQPEFRFGTDSAFVADWFNYLYPDLPQTRDYLYQGILYKNWQYFLEYVFWTQENRYPETEWLLDWYGIRYFTAGLASSATKFDKFLTRKDLFGVKHKDEDSNFYVFEYYLARPILMTSGAKPILVFGSQEDYEILVRSFAFVGWGTDRVIPVYGGKALTKFSQSQLASFPTVFLYRYSPSVTNTENDLIKDYLGAGGRILVEAFPESEPQDWPSWAPVSQSGLLEVKEEWEFSDSSGLFEGLADKNFGPPAFGDDPWKVSSGSPREKAEIWLKSKDSPVVVYKKTGQGEVIWSSLNLPYHGESYRHEEEIYLLGKLLEVSSRSERLYPVRIEKNQPQERRWVIKEKSTGLVWKESWLPRWKISWQDSQGDKGRTANFLAGPGLTYIPLPQQASYPLTIEANYHLLWYDILGWLVTIATAVILILYAFGEKILPLTVVGLKVRLANKLKGWWEKEEED